MKLCKIKTTKGIKKVQAKIETRNQEKVINMVDVNPLISIITLNVNGLKCNSSETVRVH